MTTKHQTPHIHHNHSTAYETNHDTIAAAIAHEIGFTCYLRSHIGNESKYCWRLKRDSNDPRLIGTPSIPIPDNYSVNPCSEIPIDYEVYVTIEGDTIHINNSLRFNIQDPKSIDKIKEAFTNLTALNNKLTKQ
jgi:hypothetical protein